MKHKPQIPDESVKLAARVVARLPHKENPEEVVRVEHHWYLTVRNPDGSVKLCSHIDLAEARRTLLQWGFSPMEAFNLTHTALK